MKILVAFLEKPIAEAVSQILSDLGLPQPGIVENSDAAVEWINANGGCDLLICEVYLSPADGFALRDTIQPHLPGMRTILSSAYDIAPYVDRLENTPFLPQPIAPAALRQCLEELFPSSTRPAPEAQPEPAPQPATPAVAPSPKPAPVQPSTAPRVKVAAAAQPKAAVAVKAQPAVKATPSAASPSASSMPAQELPPDELVGKTIGKFEVQALIAERDGANIYRARQTNVGRLVSLHLLNTPTAEDPELAANFLANAKSKARLSHNRVAAVYEAGESDGRCFFSCEHIGAPSLQKFQAAGTKINGTTALEIIQMAADVLDTCAKQGIPHSPLSAGTILLKTGNSRAWRTLLASRHPHPEARPPI